MKINSEWRVTTVTKPIVCTPRAMALVPGLNIGVGILVLIILWIITVLAVIALAAVPKARFAKVYLDRSVHACAGCGVISLLFL